MVGGVSVQVAQEPGSLQFAKVWTPCLLTHMVQLLGLNLNGSKRDQVRWKDLAKCFPVICVSLLSVEK